MIEENVRTWRGWFFTWVKHPWWRLTPPASRAWLNEVEHPWRHGRGVALRVLPFLTVMIGRWWPTSGEHPGYRDGEQPELPTFGWSYDEDVEADTDLLDDLFDKDTQHPAIYTPARHHRQEVSS